MRVVLPLSRLRSILSLAVPWSIPSTLAAGLRPSITLYTISTLVKRAMTAVAGSFFDLWNLPTLSLSCLVESEREEASILRTVSRVALYFQPSLTRQCLEWELDSRGDSGGEVISSLTLRVVDAAYYKLLQAQVGSAVESDSRSAPRS